MANRAYLICNDDPDPPGPSPDGSVNYDREYEIIAVAGYLIPVCWLSAFEPQDLTHFIFAGTDDDGTEVRHEIPSLVRRRDGINELVRRREMAFKMLCPNKQRYWLEWLALLEELEGSYLKIDAAEIWDAEPAFGPHLEQALVAFDDPENPDAAAALLGLADLPDPVIRNDPSSPDGIAWGHHLRGYSWERAVPWEE